MEQTESVLMNFNISPLLKSTFHDYCRYKNTSMTSQLNILIDNFIKKELYELKKQEWLEEQKNLLGVTSRKVVGLFPEQLGFHFVPVLHHLQGCLCAQG